MPVWHEASRQWVKDHDFVLLGITQEQHPDRCRLFAQWKNIDWPILHDPINVMQSRAVPIFVAIDEHGIVRDTRPSPSTFEERFLKRTFPGPPDAPEAKSTKPDVEHLRQRAKTEDTAEAWRQYGDALVLWQPAQVTEAIESYQRALQHNPKDADAKFRLGVAYRMRYEGSKRAVNDFGKAVDFWTAALDQDPNQYIWRRRIQQYGPRLIKPYPFYDWVEQARVEIRKRGEEPIKLTTEPSGAEIAQLERRFAPDTIAQKNPDPEGKISRDAQKLVNAEIVTVPGRISPGGASRIHVTLRPSDLRGAHWTNEAGPAQIWIDVPKGWQIRRRLLTSEVPKEAESREPRHLDVEVIAPKDAASGPVELSAYALYFICDGEDGTCVYLRQDLTVRLLIER